MTKRSRAVVAAFVEWILLTLAWVIFSDAGNAADFFVGVGAAAIGVVALKIVELRKLAHVAALPRCFGQAWHLPKLVMTGSWEILAVLCRQIFRRDRAKSMLFATPYSAVGGDDEAATRRALATMYTSIAPNFVIIDIDREHHYLLFHQIDESETPKMTLELGADA